MSFTEKIASAATHALAAATATLTGCAPYPSAQGKYASASASAPAQGKQLDVVTWNMDRNFQKGVKKGGSVDAAMLKNTQADLMNILEGSDTKCIIGLQECEGPWLDEVTESASGRGYKLVKGGRRARLCPQEQS